MKALLLTLLALIATINVNAQTFKQIWPADSTFKKFNPPSTAFSLPPFLVSPTPNVITPNIKQTDFNNHLKITHNMPIAKLDGFDNMPIAKLDGYYTMPIKRITLDGFTLLMPPKKPIIPTLKKPEN